MYVFRMSVSGLVLSITAIVSLHGVRSVHRPTNSLMPELITFWTDEPHGKKHSLKNPVLEEWAIFGRYDEDLLNRNRLPNVISYRYAPQQSIETTVLNDLMQEFLEELSHRTVKTRENKFKNVVILKDRNFNYALHAGLVIIKFKNYPFVAKIFIENPESFVKPFEKGSETCIFFIMGGGINRFLAGFTRIPNLEAIHAIVDNDPEWSQKIALPRKWFWKPKNVRYFTMVGKNLGHTSKERSQILPSTYAIVCDELFIERPLYTYYKADRVLVRHITQLLGNRIDPHIHNFFIEKDTNKIAIVDTEHMASMVGLKEPLEFNGNLQWYAQLCSKCYRDTMLRNKKTRLKLQNTTPPTTLTVLKKSL